MFSEKEFLSAVKEHEKIIWKVITMYQSNSGDREDLRQEILLNAWKGSKSFRGEAKFSTWLYRIAFNIVADKFRRKSVDYCDLESIEDLADNCKHLYQSDLRTDITKAMSSISDAQKVAIRLCLEEGYTHADAATEMNMPLGTVKSHVARGKANLQELLAHWSEVA